MGLFHNDTALDMCIKCGGMYNRPINSQQTHCGYCDPNRPGPWSDWMRLTDCAEELDISWRSLSTTVAKFDAWPDYGERPRMGYEIRKRKACDRDLEMGTCDPRTTWLYSFRYVGGEK